MKEAAQNRFIELSLPLGCSSLLLLILLCGLSWSTEAEPRVHAATSRGTHHPILLNYQPGVSVCAQTHNVVPNPGFEDGLNHWCGSGDCIFQVSAPGHTGNHSVGISAGSARGDRCELFTLIEEIPVEPGRFYDYSAWAKADLLTGSAYLHVTFWSRQGDPPAWRYEGDAYTTYVTDTQGAWVQATGSVQIPAEAEYARVEASVPDSSIGTVWFDDIFFGLSICLGVSKRADPDPVAPGETLTYTVVCSNMGREKASNVEIAETYDEHVDPIWADPAPLPGIPVVWIIPELPAGASITATVMVRVADDIGQRAWLCNSVQCHSDETVAPAYSTTCTRIITGSDDCGIALHLFDAEKLGTPGHQTNYDLLLCSVGSCDGQMDLVGTSSQGWDILMTPSLPYTLPAGSCRGITASLAVPQDTPGGTVDTTCITATLVCILPCSKTVMSAATMTTTVASSVFLPLVMKNSDGRVHFEGPWEIEPNDSCQEANGPLHAGRQYYGYPNDTWDFFSLDVYAAGRITVDLTIETGQGVQLLLCDRECKLLRYDYDPSYHIEYPGAHAGRYYIGVYTESGHSNDEPYILWATFP